MTRRQQDQSPEYFNFNFLCAQHNDKGRTASNSNVDFQNGISGAQLTDRLKDKNGSESMRVIKPARIVNNTNSSQVVTVSDVFEDGRGTDSLHVPTTENKEDICSSKLVKQTSPRWQTKWEVQMRPEPYKRDKQLVVSSIPIMNVPPPTPATKTTPSLTNKPRGRRKIRIPQFYSWARNQETKTMAAKEGEKFDRTSVKSTEVDQLQMLHKTGARSQNLCVQTRRLWNIEDKKKSKFLSADAYFKDAKIKEMPPPPKGTRYTYRRNNCIPRFKVLPANWYFS